MLPRRITGLCKKQQKRMSSLVTMAQKLVSSPIFMYCCEVNNQTETQRTPGPIPQLHSQDTTGTYKEDSKPIGEDPHWPLSVE
ncbi:hypothetical protein NQ317_006627 [Molorchus minor]|uniref:Uncharacterized protein n=1 Tax=Molorchus minor TaxID=1323400 RepID=A0ABQ9J0I9_9CUCU|nr:hypothetical protein NQ317_006627 [Molorchus minor]